MELVIPMDSLLKPKRSATGIAKKIVPRLPICCRISAGANDRLSKTCPLESASLTIIGTMNKIMSPSATFDS